MNKLFGVAALFLFFSCKTPSLAVKTTGTPKMDASAAILDSVKAHSFQFEWFSGKAKVEVTAGTDKTDFTANFRIKKDSAIWISASPALGIEVGRMLMTKDSIRVINRLDKKHYTKGYDFFKAYTTLPVDFYVIQNLIVGNMLFLRNNYDVKMKDSVMVLVSKDNDAKDSIVLSKFFQPLRQFINSPPAGTLFTTNDQYDIQYTPPFSLWRKIIIHHPDELIIEVTFNKVKLNEPVKFPFKGDD